MSPLSFDFSPIATSFTQYHRLHLSAPSDCPFSKEHSVVGLPFATGASQESVGSSAKERRPRREGRATRHSRYRIASAQPDSKMPRRRPRSPSRLEASRSSLDRSLSPTSDSSSSTPDPVQLDTSWISITSPNTVVHDDEDSVSTIGSSLDESVLGYLSSDSEAETRDWESDSLDHAEHGREAGNDSQITTRALDDDNSLDGSYLDAEATASDLSSSRATDVQLVYPNVEASFSTNASDTPNASVIYLAEKKVPLPIASDEKPEPRLQLQEKAELLELISVPDEPQPIEPVETLIPEALPLLPGNSGAARSLKRKFIKLLSPRNMLSAGAVTAVLTLLVLRSFSPSTFALLGHKDLAQRGSAATTPAGTAMNLPIPFEQTLQATRPSAASSVGLVPDLNIIRNALSTLATKGFVGDASLTQSGYTPEVTPEMPPKAFTSSCCSHAVAVREAGDVALTVKSVSEQPKSRRRKPMSTSVPKAVNTSSTSPCTCHPALWEDVWSKLGTQKVTRFISTFLHNDSMSWVIASATAALRADVQELLDVSDFLLHRAYNVSVLAHQKTWAAVLDMEAMIQHSLLYAWRFARTEEQLARDSVRSAFSTLTDKWSPRTARQARQGLDSATHLVEEKAALIQSAGTQTLKRARRGLDNLLEKSHLTSANKADKEGPHWHRLKRDRPLPWQMRNRRGSRLARDCAGCEESNSRPGTKSRKIRRKAEEQVGTAKRMLDVAYHGALQLVL